MLPGSMVLRNDANLRQGIPDLLVLYMDRWAMLEVKRSEDEPYRPNQEYYLDMFGQMSFASTIYPQNEDDVLHALQRSFEMGGATRYA
jgi:hypothetical protein